MKIIWNGKEYELTSNELAATNKEFVTASMMLLLSRDFASEEIRLILSKGKFHTQK